MDQNNGGIIGKINTPTTTVASGVWSLDSQFESQSGSTWPLAFPQTTIANSLKLDDSSNRYLSKSISGTSTTKLTISFWTKRTDGAGADDYVVLNSENNSSNYLSIAFGNPKIDIQIGGTANRRITNAVYRDHSAWYHVVITFDTTQSTASDRIKIYVNGVQETSFATSTTGMSQDSNLPVISSTLNYAIGDYPSQSGFGYNGYLAEFIAAYGQALDPTSFGVFNTVSNIWEPRAYTGTYGSNGFRLDFADSSALGADVSGNSNNFTVNNLTSVDQSTDTCSNNFATMNPLVYNTSTSVAFAEGNLQVATTDSAVFGAVSTIGVSSGKWYWEVKPTQIENKMAIGVTAAAQADAINNHRPGDGAFSAGIRSSGDAKLNGSSESGSWDSFTTSDIVGVALDLDNNKLYFSKNGTFMNSGNPTSGSTGTGAISLTDPASTTDGFYFFAFGDPGAGSGTANTAQFNFGSPPYSISSGNSDANGYGNFEYSVPSGYYALNTKNLAEFG